MPRITVNGNCYWPLLVSLLWCAAGVGRADADESIDYQQQIKPILRARCYACHGALKQQAGLRLDTAELAIKGGESGAAIVPGDGGSLLLQRVTAADESERMPPEGEPLAAEQIAALKQWIAENATAPADELPEYDPREHWAFKNRVRPALPTVAHTEWVRNPIDAFLSMQHEEQGLAPQPEASRAVLLRRLSIDLIGLPPTLEEIAAFENDSSRDWYEKAVDRLLNDKRHGERWARHWMDIWRYSDWWGLGDQLRNSQKHIWHWRDWIVESVNDDLPYDEMVQQMLAADELYPNDLQRLRATGYLARNWFLFNRQAWMDETVEHVSKSFLGITMNCAKCHDHKFDPIEQTDYYKLRAFFEPYHVRMDMAPGESDLARDGIPRVYDGLLDAPTYRFERGDEKHPDKSTVISPGVPELFAFKELQVQPISLPIEAWRPERRDWVIDAHINGAKKRVESAASGLEAAREKLAEDEKQEAESAAAQIELTVAEQALELAKCELSSLELRIAALRATWANTDDAGEKAAIAVKSERDVAVIKARYNIAKIELRLAQAANEKKDAIDKELKAARDALDLATKTLANPVTDNDKVTSVIGAQWTPTRFLSSGNDDPTVEFPPTSTGRRSALADWITDPRNPLTARVAVNHLWTRHFGASLVTDTFEFGRKNAPPANPQLIDWMACELIESGWSMKHLHRLIVTSAAYRMSSSVAGGETSYARDPDNRYYWRRTPIRIESQVVRDSMLALAGDLDLTMGGPSVPTAAQADSKRRSLYFFHSNNERNLFLTTFDEANVKECYRREQSIVPQQALALSNSGLVLDCAQLIAVRLSADIYEDDDTEFARRAFRGVLGAPPDETELGACVKTMEAWRQLPSASSEQARINLVWTLLNHNDFVTLR